MDEDVGVPDLSVVEESSLGGDLCTLGSDLDDLLVELGPLVVSHLSGSRHGGPDVSGSLGSQVSDSAAVLAVPVGQELDTPALCDTLESLSFGDSDDIDQGSLGAEVGEVDLGSEDLLCVCDPLVDGSASDPELHEVGDLLGDSGDELGLGVDEDTDILDVDTVIPCERGLVVVLGNVEALVEEGVEVLCPDLSCCLQSDDAALVESDRCDLHRGNLDDGHGGLDLHSGGGALCAFVDDKCVSHTGLVSSESLDFRSSADLGPRVEPRRLRLCSLPRAVCPRSSLGTSSLRHIYTYLRGSLR